VENEQLIEQWRLALDRQHQDHQDTLRLFERLQLMNVEACAGTQEKVLEKIESIRDKGVFWRTGFALLLGVLGGLLGAGLPLIVHVYQQDGMISVLVARQEFVLAELEKNRVAHEQFLFPKAAPGH
jgi:hypothetical protein